MMNTLYVISPQSIPSLSTLETVLKDVCTIVSLPKAEALAVHREQKGVVLFQAEPGKIATQAGIIRTMAPLMSTLAVVPQRNLDQLPPDTLNLTDILVDSSHPAEIKARINTAFHLSELRKLIEETAQLDEVTGLYSYHYFIKRLGEEMSLAKRHLSPVTCVIISISMYDIYMDSYGFEFVSNFMQQIAQITKDVARQEDVIARLGNNEIGFLLPRSSEKGAATLTKRIISKVESMPLYMGDQVEYLHLNAGIAGFPTLDQEDIDADTLIRYTRHALHHARCQEDENIQLFSEMKPFVG